MRYIFLLLFLFGCANAQTTPTPAVNQPIMLTPNPSISADADVELLPWTYLPPWELEDAPLPDEDDVVVLDQERFQGRPDWNKMVLICGGVIFTARPHRRWSFARMQRWSFRPATSWGMIAWLSWCSTK